MTDPVGMGMRPSILPQMGTYGYDATTAPPGMQWLYQALAPAPNTQYGNLLPVAKDSSGVRPAMPDMLREGLLGMADLLSGTQTGELTQRGANSMTLGGMGVGMGMAPAEALAMGGKPIRAFHGSPHNFDRFDSSRIGTGEGAQAYGHGLYFAENEGVATNYRNLAPPPGPITPEVKQALREMGYLGFDTPGEAMGAVRQYPDWMKRFDLQPSDAAAARVVNDHVAANPRGHMYEVAIDADPQRFLDWDKPLSGQGAPVQKALEQFGYKADTPGLRAFDDALLAALHDQGPATLPKQPPNPLGANIYESGRVVPGGYRDPRAASNTLRDAGIPGIRYLDGGSRTAGEGSSNYVVFPNQDEIIKILRKYGMAAPAPVGLPNSMLPPDQKVY